jgi:hypothetical protein
MVSDLRYVLRYVEVFDRAGEGALAVATLPIPRAAKDRQVLASPVCSMICSSPPSCLTYP